MRQLTWYTCIALGVITIAGISMQAVRASSGYTKDLVDLLEVVYGDGLLELGGQQSIDAMFTGIDLNGKHVLDVGAGLGGVDTYLASKYTATIIGVDPEMSLVERAAERAAKLRKSLIGSVSFAHLPDPTSLRSHADNSFDIVMSRGALLHAPREAKGPYFVEMLRVLKPGGILVIDDWMHTSPEYTQEVIDMMQADGIAYHLLTPVEYVAILAQSGFETPVLRDTTERSYAESVATCELIESMRDTIEQRFGGETYGYALASWTTQTNAFKRRELLTGTIVAHKPPATAN